MRDPKRIQPIMDEVIKYWNRYPDQRFGQILSNLLSGLCALDKNIQDIFYVEDDRWLRLLKQLNGGKEDDINGDITKS